MKFLPSIYSKIPSILSKNNLFPKIGGVVTIVAGVIAIAADSLDIKDKFFSTDKKEVIIEDSIANTKEAILLEENKNNKKSTNNPASNTETKNKKPIVTKKTISYFNTNDSTLNDGKIALFIKNSSNQIDYNYQENLSTLLLENNIHTSGSFFTNQSMVYYNQFYSANNSWLVKVKIKKHIPKYLIGKITTVISKSSEDTSLSIVNLQFNGKIVDILTNQQTIVKESVRETNYQEFKAKEDAYHLLSVKIKKHF